MSLRDCERLFAAIGQIAGDSSFSSASRLEMVAVLAGVGSDALRDAREKRERASS